MISTKNEMSDFFTPLYISFCSPLKIEYIFSLMPGRQKQITFLRDLEEPRVPTGSQRLERNFPRMVQAGRKNTSLITKNQGYQKITDGNPENTRSTKKWVCNIMSNLLARSLRCRRHHFTGNSGN